MSGAWPYATPSEGYRTEDAYGARGGTLEGAVREIEDEWHPSRPQYPGSVSHYPGTEWEFPLISYFKKWFGIGKNGNSHF